MFRSPVAASRVSPDEKQAQNSSAGRREFYRVEGDQGVGTLPQDSVHQYPTLRLPHLRGNRSRIPSDPLSTSS